MAHQSFKRARAKEPVTFDLWDKDDNPVTYRCAKSMPVGVLLDFGDVLAGGDESANQIIPTVMSLFKSAIVPEDWDRFNAALHDPELDIDLAVLTDIASWLMDQYSGDRPTGAPSEPGSSRTSSGESLTGGVSPGVLTYSRSEVTVPSL